MSRECCEVVYPLPCWCDDPHCTITRSSPTGRYHDRDEARPAKPTTITAITITMHTPPLDPAPAPARPPQPPTRRQRITAIMNSDPSRSWSGRELAESLQVNLHNMLTQLSEWTRLGFLTRTSSGTYTLATPP
jgi:hypothetical protein